MGEVVAPADEREQKAGSREVKQAAEQAADLEVKITHCAGNQRHSEGRQLGPGGNVPDGLGAPLVHLRQQQVEVLAIEVACHRRSVRLTPRVVIKQGSLERGHAHHEAEQYDRQRQVRESSAPARINRRRSVRV